MSDERRWSEQGNEPRIPWSICFTVAKGVLFVVMLSEIPGAIFNILNPTLRKGFEVELSWVWLAATILLGISLGRQLLNARRAHGPRP